MSRRKILPPHERGKLFDPPGWRMLHPVGADEPPPTYYESLCDALREILLEKKVFTAQELQLHTQMIESPGAHNGAKLVARAWIDAEFRRRLLSDGKAAAAELGLRVGETQLVVLENTPKIHNFIVCTLCSCYPRSILGQPPAWYRSKEYRSRVVREPRAVLAEFGTPLPPSVEVRVHDSNADMRYMVLPMKPEGTQGLDEAQLAKLVTRDSLIGVVHASSPSHG